MKTLFSKIFTLFIVTSVLSCGDKSKEAKTEDAKAAAVAEASAVVFSADASKSTIEWKGFKPTGSHTGTISVSKGNVKVNDGKIESGTFMIDMKSITVTDIPAEKEGNAKLRGHLTSADFFDVETYPTAQFTVTGIDTKDGETMLSGNLKLKDATNNVTFPVSTSIDGDKMTLTSDTFTIDRSKWNVKYGSKSFFDDLGDKFINDDIELKVNLVATKS